MCRRDGFTLIELLIVIAIILILIGIALPNFLEAQVRAKMVRATGDIKSLGTALLAYATTNRDFPWYPRFSNNPAVNPYFGFTPPTLTTPQKFMSRLPNDPFEGPNGYDPPFPPNVMNLYNYECRTQYISWGGKEWDTNGPGNRIQWIIVSRGPDGFPLINEPGAGAIHGNALEYFQARAMAVALSGWYSPTNGTKSRGDIVGWGPNGTFEFPGMLFGR